MVQMKKNEKVYLDIHATEFLLAFLGMAIGLFGAYVLYEVPDRLPESLGLISTGVLANVVAFLGVREKTRCSQ